MFGSPSNTPLGSADCCTFNHTCSTYLNLEQASVDASGVVICFGNATQGLRKVSGGRDRPSYSIRRVRKGNLMEIWFG